MRGVAVVAVGPPAGSISFVITARRYTNRIDPLLKLVASAMRPEDEVILLVSIDDPETATFRPAWMRVVKIPDASIFQLRGQIPVICQREWVVLLEDHVMIEPSAVEEIRTLIREQPGLDLIPFVAKNLTSTGTWDWAIFLFTFALVWAPLDHPPPFSPVTSAIVRRTSLGSGAPLKDGEWELRTISRLFQTGKLAFSNAIFIDHIKAKSFLEALINIYYNSRSGAGLQLALGNTPRKVIREGWYNFVRRPGELMRAVAARKHVLPTGTRLRLHVLGFTHMVGYILGVLFGGDRAAYELDMD
jgi:hypothetical protein